MRLPALLAALGLLAVAPPAPAQDLRVKIGVINDQSGVYSDASGRGSVVAAHLAADEFRAGHPGVAVEIVDADHGNKPDTASAIVRRWLERENVDAVADIQNSAVALAVQNIAREAGKVSLATGAVTPELTGRSCSPTGILWSLDAYALANGPVQALSDRKRWFFITVDLAGGLLFENEGRLAVAAAGDQVVGSARHPLGTADMSAFLLQAKAAGADVVALANAGGDTVNAIKGASEFGLLQAGIAVAPLLFFEPDIRAVGLPVAQGMVLGTGFYWDLNDRTRAFARAFEARFNRKPTQYQASVYAAVRHYLLSVADAGTTDAPRVMEAMRRRPADYLGDRPGSIRPDGRVVYDVHVMQVKAPGESRDGWDLLKPLRTIPGEEAFRPEKDSACPLARRG